MTQRTARRQFLTAATALAAGSMTAPFAQAQAAEYKMKFASNLPAVHPLNVRATEAADAIRKETGGRVDIQVFPNNQLGSDTDMLSQVRSGAIDFFTLSGLILSTLVPVASINGIGFAFKDYEQVWAAMDGDLGAFVRGAIAKSGLVAFDKIWDNGFRQTTSLDPADQAKPGRFQGIQDPRARRARSGPRCSRRFDASPMSASTSAKSIRRCRPRSPRAKRTRSSMIDTAKLYEVQKYLLA